MVLQSLLLNRLPFPVNVDFPATKWILKTYYARCEDPAKEGQMRLAEVGPQAMAGMM